MQSFLDHHGGAFGSQMERFFECNQKLIKIPETPEGALFSEVLCNAIHIIRNFKNKSCTGGAFDYRSIYRETQAWFRAGNVGAISFDDCLALLSSEPQQLKAQILKLIVNEI